MATLKKLSADDPTKAFPLKDQYVPNVKAAQALLPEKDVPRADPDEPAGGGAGGKPSKRKAQRDPDWNYSEVRKAFINKAKHTHGIGFAAAKQMWDSSDEKRLYLKHVTVAELKRRKFIGKDVMENPWA